MGTVQPPVVGFRRELLREGGVHLRRRLQRGLQGRVAQRARVPRAGMGRRLVRPSAARQVDDRARDQGLRDGSLRVADRLGGRGHTGGNGPRPDRAALVRTTALDVPRGATPRPRAPERRAVAAGAVGRPRAALDRRGLPLPGPGPALDRRADPPGATGGQGSRPLAPVEAVALRGRDRLRGGRRGEVVRRARDRRGDRDLAGLGDVEASLERHDPRRSIRAGTVPGEFHPARRLRDPPVHRVRGDLPPVAASLRLEGRGADRPAEAGGEAITCST